MPRFLHRAVLARGDPAGARQGSRHGRQAAGRPRDQRAGLRGDRKQRAGDHRGHRRRQEQISFYGSTPAYRKVLELHGWGALHDELNALSKRDGWDQMPDLIEDDLLHTFAVVGEPEYVAAELNRRYGDIVHRITLTVPYQNNPDRWAAFFDAVRTPNQGL